MSNILPINLSSTMNNMTDAKLQECRKVSQDFESYIAADLMKKVYMVSPDPIFGGGAAEEMFTSFLLDEYGKQIAVSANLGVAEQTMRQLIRLQEKR